MNVALYSTLRNYIQAHPSITLAHGGIVDATALLQLWILPCLFVHGFLHEPHVTYSSQMDIEKKDKLFTSLIDDP